MEAITNRNNSFLPIIIIALLIVSLALILWQQKQIGDLKEVVYDQNYKIDNLDKKLTEVQYSLSGQISDLRRTVIIYSR